MGLVKTKNTEWAVKGGGVRISLQKKEEDI